VAEKDPKKVRAGQLGMASRWREKDPERHGETIRRLRREEDQKRADRALRELNELVAAGVVPNPIRQDDS
jgi:hypothetical protein